MFCFTRAALTILISGVTDKLGSGEAMIAETGLGVISADADAGSFMACTTGDYVY